MRCSVLQGVGPSVRAFDRMQVRRRAAMFLGAALVAATLVTIDGTTVSAAQPADLLVTTLDDTISKVNTATDQVVAGPVDLSGSSDPWAIAITPDGATAFVAGHLSNTVTPVTVSTLAVQSNLCLPSGGCPPNAAARPQAVAVTPDGSAAVIANSGVDKLSIVSIGTGAVSNTPIDLPDDSRASAIAISPDGDTAYVAAYHTGTVIPVALPSGPAGTPITVGSGPTGLAITPDGSHLYVANSGSGSTGSVSDVNLTVGPPAVTTFDPQPSEPGRKTPHAVAISPDGATAFVTDVTTNRLVPIEIATNTPRSPVSVGSFPTGVAISPDGERAYVANQIGESLSVFTLSGTSISAAGSISIPGGPTALAFVPDQAPVASFTVDRRPTGAATSFDASASRTTPAGGVLTYRWDFGDGSASGALTSPLVQHTYLVPGTYTVTLVVTNGAGTSTTKIFTGQTMSRNGGPVAETTRSLSIQRATSLAAPLAIVAASGSDEATPLSLDPSVPSAAAGPEIAVEDVPSSVAITPNGKTAYVVNRGSNSVTPISMDTGIAGASIDVGSTPEAIAITPDGSAAWVVNGSGSVQRITIATGAVGSPINVGGAPSAIAIAPSGNRAYVTNAADNTISAIDLVTHEAAPSVSATGLANPSAIAVSPNGTVAYVVSRGGPTTTGGMTSFDLAGDSPAAVNTVFFGGVGGQPNAIAVSSDGTRAFVTTASGSIVRITLAGTVMTVGATTPVATQLSRIAITPDDSALYATGIAATAGGPRPSVIPVAIGAALLTPASPVIVGGDPKGIAITPDQAANAQLQVTPSAVGVAPKAVSFDASGSSAATSPIASYAWDFGDGTLLQTTVPTANHTYNVGGSFTAAVTLTTEDGTSVNRVGTGQTLARNGSNVARAERVVVVRPTVTSVTPSDGSAGTPVSIAGTGFSTVAGETTIEFGPTPATNVSCASNILCTADAPAGTGPVVVKVTVGGQSNPSNAPHDVFTYDPAPFRPDARIRRAGQPGFSGAGIYSDVAIPEQTISRRMGSSGRRSFDLQFLNAGTSADAFTITGCGPKVKKQSFRYFDAGGNDVTSQVVAGTYTTATLNPGEFEDMTLLVRANPKARGKVACDFVATSTQDLTVPPAVDVVRLISVVKRR